jgi:drug/metabolite transporter (DMT)-like permease
MWQLYLFLAVLFMGFNSFIVKILVKKIHPNVVMLYQFILATPLVFSYLLISNWDYAFSPWLILIGFGYFASLTYFYNALIKGNLTKAGPLWSLNLVITALLGFFFLKEQFDWKIGAGLMFSVLSIYFLRGNEQ